MRINRICSNIADYDCHAKLLIENFVQMRFYRKKFEAAQNFREMNRADLLTHKRVPIIVLTYHHKFEGFSSSMKAAYKRETAKFPALRTMFPQQPMITFRRSRNIRDKIIRANYYGQSIEQGKYSATEGCSLLANQTNLTASITNHNTNSTFY